MKPTIYTATPPRMARNERARWRVAYATVFFNDNTHASIALACAPTKSVREDVLRETGELLLEGFKLTYPGIVALPMRFYKTSVVNGRGEIQADSEVSVLALSLYERLHTLEYYAFYYSFSFLERLVVAYEGIPAHSMREVDVFAAQVHALRAVNHKGESA